MMKADSQEDSSRWVRRRKLEGEGSAEWAGPTWARLGANILRQRFTSFLPVDPGRRCTAPILFYFIF